MNDVAYWDYTLEDLFLKDLPQILNYIGSVTHNNNGLIFIGHSLGCTLPLLFASQYPKETNKMLKSMILMAPALSISHGTSLINLAAKSYKKIYGIVKKKNLMSFLPNGQLARQLLRSICNKKNIKLCYGIFNFFMTNKNTVTSDMFPVALNVYPQGGSINMAIQVARTISSPLSKFDYGKSKNKLKYGKSEPPIYNLENIKIPVHIIAAVSDNIISYKDALQLYNNLSLNARSGFYNIPTKHFTHVDLGLGKYIEKMLNEQILQYLIEETMKT